MAGSSETQRPLLVGVREVSKLLDLNADGVYQLVRSGELPSIAIASGGGGIVPRKLRIPYAAVEDYVERRLQQELRRQVDAAPSPVPSDR